MIEYRPNPSRQTTRRTWVAFGGHVELRVTARVEVSKKRSCRQMLPVQKRYLDEPVVTSNAEVTRQSSQCGRDTRAGSVNDSCSSFVRKELFEKTDKLRFRGAGQKIRQRTIIRVRELETRYSVGREECLEGIAITETDCARNINVHSQPGFGCPLPKKNDVWSRNI